jgi:type I restriction enzyme S subunit
LIITVPPIEEQIEIISNIEKYDFEFQKLIHLEQKKIDLLKEYRQSLISEVVTGKVKVTQ